MKLSVAIDGPAGAGKSTIAKILGEKYNLMYINTGAMYRAITLLAQRKNISPLEVEKLCKMADKLTMHFDGDKIIVDNKDLSGEVNLPSVSEKVSNYASIPEIRTRLVKVQRNIAEKYNVIMDGRDIGTVVLKDAPLKFYLNASPQKRAMRRYKELAKNDIKINYEKVLSDIIERDYLDMNRRVDPLKKASSAIEIDSSDMTIDEVVEKIGAYIKKASEDALD